MSNGRDEGLEKLGLLFGAIILLLILLTICTRTAPTPCADVPGSVPCSTELSPCGCCESIDPSVSKCRCAEPCSVWDAARQCCRPPDSLTCCTTLQQGGKCAPGQTPCDLALPGCQEVGGCCRGGYAWNEALGCCATIAGTCQCPAGRECPEGETNCPTDPRYGKCCAAGYYWDNSRKCCWNATSERCQPVCEGGCCTCPPGVECRSGCCDASGNCIINCTSIYGEGYVPCPPGVDCASGCCKQQNGEWVCAGSGGGVPPETGGDACAQWGLVSCASIGVGCPNGAQCCTTDGECPGACSQRMSRYDLNGDCTVDKNDADAWDAWYAKNVGDGGQGMPCPPTSLCHVYDLNNDAFIDTSDRSCLCAVCDCEGIGWRCAVPGCAT